MKPLLTPVADALYTDRRRFLLLASLLREVCDAMAMSAYFPVLQLGSLGSPLVEPSIGTCPHDTRNSAQAQSEAANDSQREAKPGSSVSNIHQSLSFG